MHEHWVVPQNCKVCGKLIPGAFGHTLLGEKIVWSCCGQCEREIQRMKGELNDSIQRASETKVGGAGS